MRVGKSYLDEYKSEIMEMLSAGMYIKHIAEGISKKYGIHVAPATVHNYVTKRNLRAKHSIQDAPVCDTCTECRILEMTTGMCHRFCMVDNKQIVDSVTLSPRRCKRRNRDGTWKAC